jgi:hypothetical protein
MAAPAMAEENMLDGDERLACEAILCLSSGSRPSECDPAINHYYSIKKKKWSDTVKARQDFLEQCPAANESGEMKSLVAAISRGAGQCDAVSLNQTVTYWVGSEDGRVYIDNSMPDYCTVYTSHQYTDLVSIKPVYVGVPERGGFWVAPDQYEKALAEYNARIAREDAELASSSGG